MCSDEQPVDEHAECYREIAELHAEVTRLQGGLAAHAENCATWVRSLPELPDDWTGHPTDAMAIVWNEVERLQGAIVQARSDEAGLSDDFQKLIEAAGAVVDEWEAVPYEIVREWPQSWDLAQSMTNLRLAAVIDTPPADETHDPDPDGDRLGEGR